MFLNLAQSFQAAGRPPEDVFLVHPLQLHRVVEEAWAMAGAVPVLTGGGAPQAPFLGSTTIVGDLDLPTQPGAPPFLAPSGLDPANPDQWTEQLGQVGPNLIWHHLMYAYLIESTGAFEIFTEVVKRLVIGESFGELQGASVRWLRTTEELFFRDPPLFSVAGVVSELRPHGRINRRNAYWRMFGLDLPHPGPSTPGASTEPWKAGLGGAYNADFRAKWTELLRQVWLGLENRNNASGANATDASYVVLLCQALRDMMHNRRRGGMLAREEFTYVTALSWFHLTILSDTPIIADLKAQGASPDARLANVASRVGMKAAARTRELELLSEKVSAVLRAIELNLFDTETAAEALYTPPSILTSDMNQIIDLWQSATGDRIKGQTPATFAAAPQPLRAPTPAGVSSNGSGS